MSRGKGMSYGERECERCGREYEAHSSRAKWCETCRTVRQAASMRNEPAECRGCGQRFHRRDGKDYFCPECHLIGLGDERYAPRIDEPLERCEVCQSERVPSIAPHF